MLSVLLLTKRTISLTFILLLLRLARAGIGKSEIRVANLEENVSIFCVFQKGADKMRWSFRKTDNDNWDIIYDARTQPNAEVKCNKVEKYCKIDISQPTENRAGSYRFEYGVNGQPMTIACSYELILGELKCESSLRQSGILVGESDCSVKAETFVRTCSFSYFGNYNVSSDFIWTKKLLPSAIARDRLLQGSEVKSEGRKKILKAEDSVQVSNDLDKVIYECSLNALEYVHPCKLPQISIQYGKNKLENNQQGYTGNPKNIECAIDKSNNLDCSYKWEVDGGNVKMNDNRQSSHKDHLLTHCPHRCQASCTFVTGERCQFFGPSFDFCQISGVNGGWKAFAILSALFAIFFLAVALTFIIIKFKQKKSKKVESEGKSEPLLQNTQPQDDIRENTLISEMKERLQAAQPVNYISEENANPVSDTKEKLQDAQPVNEENVQPVSDIKEKLQDAQPVNEELQDAQPIRDIDEKNAQPVSDIKSSKRLSHFKKMNPAKKPKDLKPLKKKKPMEDAQPVNEELQDAQPIRDIDEKNAQPVSDIKSSKRLSHFKKMFPAKKPKDLKPLKKKKPMENVQPLTDVKETSGPSMREAIKRPSNFLVNFNKAVAHLPSIGAQSMFISGSATHL